MKLHANAPFGPKGRLTMVRRVAEQGWSLTEAAEAAGVSERTVCKWVGRYRAEGEAGLRDRSSAPRSMPNRTSEDRLEAIAALRRVRMTGLEIAECLAMAPSTVSAVLLRIGLGKLSRLEAPEPPNRYERRRAGELIHIDVKKLVRIEKGAGHRMTGRRTRQARGAGWEHVHVCVDDATRLAYVEVLKDEKAKTAIGFLKRVIAFYAAHGVIVERVMTDNGPAYLSAAHALACRALRIRHVRTRPRRPRTNGPRRCLAGWTSITGADRTAPSVTGRPELGSPS
jgi:transposase